MKYCTHCGSPVADEAVFCVKCGCPTTPNNAQTTYQQPQPPVAKQPSGFATAAKVFMILSCIAYAFFLIPLAWMIPMTVKYSNATKNGEPVSTGFKVCSLLFVNLLAGIFMLVDGDN
ncbi:MAG: zinc-ribbon domain-containing protein [Clostridia bacterium]|nr:zinc-ribbon domain-containing protein [Clostridia bacterium]